jgi:hypothetical protein
MVHGLPQLQNLASSEKDDIRETMVKVTKAAKEQGASMQGGSPFSYYVTARMRELARQTIDEQNKSHSGLHPSPWLDALPQNTTGIKAPQWGY